MRVLEPGRVPASCQNCKPCELTAQSRVYWQTAGRFPSTLRRESRKVSVPRQVNDDLVYVERYVETITVDYPAALSIADRLPWLDPIFFIECLEAIKRGYNGE